MVVGIVLFAGIFGTAIAAIISKSILKYREMELTAQANKPIVPPDSEEIAMLVQSIKLLKQDNDQLRAQQAELQQRLQRLEQARLPDNFLSTTEQSTPQDLNQQ